MRANGRSTTAEPGGKSGVELETEIYGEVNSAVNVMVSAA